MNPPTVLCHLAGSLTQSIRSNEPQLIFTRDGEIGSLQPAPFHFSFVDQFRNQHERLECEGRTRAGEHIKAEK